MTAACERCGCDVFEPCGDDNLEGDDMEECRACFRTREIETPACLESMGCLCAGHARGNAASDACDTSEGPPKATGSIMFVPATTLVANDCGLDGVVMLRPATPRHGLTIGGHGLHVYAVRIRDAALCPHQREACGECPEWERPYTEQRGDGADAERVAEKLLDMTEARVETFEIDGLTGRWAIYAEPHGD